MKKIIFFFTLILLAPAVSFGASTDPFLYLTWKAKSYTPDNFLGKILPGANSPILVSLEAFENGKVADISGSQIKWYIDGELFSTAVGQKSFTIRTDKKPTSGVMSIRAEVLNKWKTIKMKTVDIPISPPVIILKSNYLSRTFGDNKISVSASPYFFGVIGLSDLVFSWKVNGVVVNSAENPQAVDISFNEDADPGSSVIVESSIVNPSGIREVGYKKEIFKYIP